MFRKTQKGFLGPIGDDLPSLIPLLFALMLFFYVFTITWNVFDERGRAFENSLAALRVGNSLKGNNYISGIEAFGQRCNEAKSIKRIKFLGGLLPLSTGPGQNFEVVDIETLESRFFGETEVFSCTNAGESPNAESDGLVIISFPVALEINDTKPDGTKVFYVRPMLLVAVTWR